MLTERFDQALLLAASLHRGQLRKGSDTPYLAHLLSVAALVIEHGGDEDEAIAALLHDAVEDQGGAPTAAQIRARFGARVADIVEGCTDTDEMPKPPWRVRKEAYLAHLPHAPASVRLVSCADKLHNARTTVSDLRALGPVVFDRFRGGRDGTLWYYRSLVEAYRQAPADPRAASMLENLAREVDLMHALSGAPA